MLLLLDNVQSDTVGEYLASNGHQGMLYIAGNLGGGTITLQVSKDPVFTDLDIQDTTQTAFSFTAPGAISQLSIPSGTRIRATLAGSTGPSVSVAME